MLNTVKEMLQSKKFVAALVTAVVWGVARFGVQLDTEELIGLVTPLHAYIIGQGVADFGKSKAAA